jgi:hypothetical protein
MYQEEVQEEVAPALVVMTLTTEEKIEVVVVMLSKNN